MDTSSRTSPPETPPSPSAAVPVPRIRVLYHGRGTAFVALLLKNLALVTLSLGFYYPWAKTNLRRYLWQNFEINGYRLEYTGTGGEIFRGYLKVYGIYVSIVILISQCSRFIPNEFVPILQAGLAALVAAFIPLLVFNSLRYLASRTRYRGIHLNLMSGRADYLGTTYLGVLLSVLTAGLYYPVLKNQQRKIIFEHLRYGNLAFEYSAKNGEILSCFLKGLILSVLTAGLYSFKAIADFKNLALSGIKLDRARTELSLTGMDVFTLSFGWLAVAILTLGIGIPWFQMFSFQLIASRVEFHGLVDFEKVIAIRDTAGAGGNSAADAFDIDLGVA